MNINLISYSLLILCLIIINSISYKLLEGSIMYYTWFVSFVFVLTFYILDQIKNYIYYYLIIFISTLISGLFLLQYIKPIKRIAVKFELILLFILSLGVFIVLGQSLVNLKKNNENEAKYGYKGLIGVSGEKGAPAHYMNQNDLCTSQLIHAANTKIKEYLTNNHLLQNETDDDIAHNDFLKNNYVKQTLKRICNSANYNDYMKDKGSYAALTFLKNKVSEWMELILKYKQGYNFIKDYSYNDNNWDYLLSKNKLLEENENPFDVIKRDKIQETNVTNLKNYNIDPIWNW